MKRTNLLGLVLLASMAAATLSGCMVGPNFHKPNPEVPSAWVGPTPTPGVEPVDLSRWWTSFNDPVLSGLIRKAVESGLDLKLAEARIRQARAVRGIAASGLGPSITLPASATRSRASGGASRLTGLPSDTKGPITNQFQAGFDAAWEIDIFGGVRRGIEAADADLRATVENYRNVLVTLAAEVATNYVDLRAFQQRALIAGENLAAQKHTAALTQQRFEGGFVSGLDVANANAQVATTASQIPLLESSAQQTIYRIGILLGLNPGVLMQELSPPKQIPLSAPVVPTVVPSDLLRRRPDIRQAEENIHGATARIGVATSDLFPKFDILGSAGYQSAHLSSWFNPVSNFWSIGPSMNWNVFASGRIRSNIEQQRALEEQALITYRQTVLGAFEEVENALIASAKEEEHRRALVQAVTANRKAVELATKIYTEGQTDFLSVLDAQRSLYVTEDALVQSNSAVSIDLIALYKALGGGWEDSAHPDSLAAQ